MGSFAEAKSCVDRYGKENTLLLFADVRMEDPDLYRFIDDVVDFLGVELKVLDAGKTPWELFKERKFIGNHLVDICSSKLKREPLIKYIDEMYGMFKELPLLDYKGEPLLNIFG